MEITLPTSWEDLTIKEFPELYDVIQDTSLDQIEKNIHMISILSKQRVEDIEAYFSLRNLKLIEKKLGFLYDTEMGPPPKQFYFKGYKWRVKLDISEITGGEYIDLCSLVKNKENIIRNAAKILAIFCVPVQRKWYQIKHRDIKMDFNTRSQTLEELPMSIAYPITLFFWNFWNHYTNLTEIFLTEEMTKELMNMEKDGQLSQNIGDGSQS